MPTPKGSHCSAVVGQQFYVFGGYMGTSAIVSCTFLMYICMHAKFTACLRHYMP